MGKGSDSESRAQGCQGYGPGVYGASFGQAFRIQRTSELHTVTRGVASIICVYNRGATREMGFPRSYGRYGSSNVWAVGVSK